MVHYRAHNTAINAIALKSMSRWRAAKENL